MIRPYAPKDEQQVLLLWQRCSLTRPWNDPSKDIQRKLTTQPELFLVLDRANQIVGTVMAGYDGHRGWVNYLAVDPDFQKQGIGRQLMVAVEELLLARGCPKLNLQVRSGNTGAIGFYSSLGYSQDEVVSFGKRLIKD